MCLLAVLGGERRARRSAAGRSPASLSIQDGAPCPGRDGHGDERRTGGARHAVSTAAGVYTLAGLRAGRLPGRRELSGFRPVRRDGVRVETGETVRLDFALAVGDVTETVTVTAERRRCAPPPVWARWCREEKIAALPLNGRSFITLAALAPGVALPPASQLPRINGGRPRTNEYLFDGISVLQPEPGQVAFFPVIDAIQEFKIETNSPPAEFGRFNGGVVNLTTKSGTNALHGTAFEFFRHEALNARNYFATANADQAGVPPQPVRRRARRAAAARSHVLLRGLPGAAAAHRPHGDLDRADARCSGRASSPRRSPAACRSSTTRPRRPTAARFTRTPFAGRRDSGRPDGSRGARRCCSATRCRRPPAPPTTIAGRPTRWTIRTRWTSASISSDRRTATSVFGRLTNFRGTFLPVTPLPDGSGVTTGTLGPQDTTSWAFASNYQRTFSPNLLNELRFGDTRRTVARTAAQLATSRGLGAEHSRHPVVRAVSEHAADVHDRRLSAARIAAEHGDRFQHQRDRGRRHADLGAGPPHGQDRLRLALGAAERDPAAVADRLVHLQHARQRPARRRPTPARRSPASCSARCRRSRSTCRTEQIQERARVPGVLHPGRLAGLEPADDQSRACATR